MKGARRGADKYVWDSASIERLKALWGTMSAAHIAMVMGAGLTANSILGKMRRVRASEKKEEAKKAYRRRSRRATAISPKERARIIGGVVARHKAGIQPAEIGEKYRIRAQLVRRLLREEGFAINEPDPSTPGHADPMWEMDDDERRDVILRRASAGARVALAEMAKDRLMSDGER